MLRHLVDELESLLVVEQLGDVEIARKGES
jgi:hypothetical protein